ncbi:VOC family protein [Acidovorax sp. SUPP2522]|uniref:VOC family protein n=1 Tax=unclassified Acidovorax TaxID=2684926 RepID=UPI002349CA65|nr:MULTISPECIES: VOC family protein [unclassified Acidovorax]WCM97551.1 VOC family protein [Acidovorax sp. GBBC 1281]GKT18610.1 VOC family protein [Acidovorax sp. SUPP2522]
MTSSAPASSVSAISWFKIPCADLGRAQAFYEQVLGRPMQRQTMGGDPLAVFAYDRPATGGCLIEGPSRRVAPDAGTRIYLDCAPGLDAAVDRIAPAGGRVIDACIELPNGIGFIAHLCDTEGNTVGLHAMAR